MKVLVRSSSFLWGSFATDMPRKVYELMDLYPQSRGGKPSVMYVPMRRAVDQKNTTPDYPPLPRPQEK